MKMFNYLVKKETLDSINYRPCIINEYTANLMLIICIEVEAPIIS